MAKLCVALDTNLPQALELVKSLRGYPLIFKIGYKLFISHHRAITDKVKENGFELFLDLKLHDIPNTVKDGILSAKDLGADYLTVHLSSGKEALSQAVSSKGKLKLLGVSLLTSLEKEDIKEMGVCLERDEYVLNLVRKGAEAGVDGVVCSGHEARMIREKMPVGFLIVVPGIRLEGEPRDDQKRVVSIEEALEAGADILVMGRSVLRAENPIKKVEEILLRIT